MIFTIIDTLLVLINGVFMENATTPNSEQGKRLSAGNTDIEKNDSPTNTTAAPLSSSTETQSHRTGQIPEQQQFDPFKKIIIFAFIVLILLIALLVYTSHLNTKKYFLRTSEGALEVWKGTFSPAGKTRLVIMPGVKPLESIKPVYSRVEVYPLICIYYIDKSDALIHVPGMPDFIGIKTYLNRALIYATTQEHRQNAMARLNRIERMTLFYKADVAAGRGSTAGLETALGFLDKAADLSPDEIEAELIEKKKEAVLELLKKKKTD
jgi:hypothetical protein